MTPASLANYAYRDLESYLSAASERADRAARDGDEPEARYRLRERRQAQLELARRNATHALLSARTLEEMDCARSELRLATEELATLTTGDAK